MRKKTKKTPWSRIFLPICIVVITAAIVWVMATALAEPEPSKPSVTKPPQATIGVSASTEATVTEASDPVFPMELHNGLVLIQAGGYNGVYMEDGSNRIVSDVFMIRLENTSDQDLQYAEVILTVDEQEYNFHITNLPAGGAVVALEQNGSQRPALGTLQAEVRNLAWFTEPMHVDEDIFRITGGKGVVNVKNISEEPVDGVIYVYYKYKADDIFFGGITFRVKVDGGLAPGEIRQVPSGHFDPESCEVVDVTVYES